MTTGHGQVDRSTLHPGTRELREDGIRLGVKDPDNLPYYLCPPGATTAALLVHGFTATPWEMRLLAESLAETGIASLAVRLPGHGTSPEDLAGRQWEEWESCIVDGYRILQQDFAAIYGMGMSTGCLLLLNLATKVPFKGLVLFSPYLRMLHKLAPYAGLLQWFRPYQEKQDDNDPGSRYYKRRPLAGIHQINRLIKVISNRLAKITCPVLSFNGEGDQTVDISSSYELMDALGSAVKIHKTYGENVPHVLTREDNPYRQAMFNLVSRFVQEIENPGKPSVVR